LRTTEGDILFNEHIAGDGSVVFARARRLGAEGIVSKKVDSTCCRSGQCAVWIKVRNPASIAVQRELSLVDAIGEKRARSAWTDVHQAADRVNVDRLAQERQARDEEIAVASKCHGSERLAGRPTLTRKEAAAAESEGWR